MTFDDMDDVALAAEYYMFSSQVDGEQDLLETPPKSTTTVNNVIVNGVSGHRQNGSVESVVKQEPSMAVVSNSFSNRVDNNSSILARHLSIVTVKPPPLLPNANITQTQDNTYACEQCPAKLKNKRNFDTHMKRHRGELPFKCEECPKTFQGRRDLDTHKRSRHDPAKKTIVSTDSSIILPQSNSVSQAPKQKTIILSMNPIPNPLIQGLYLP